MMKKLTLIVVLLMSIVLTGCGNKEKRVAISDMPETNIAADLNLEAVKNGIELNKELDKTSKYYYTIKIAEDAFE